MKVGSNLFHQKNLPHVNNVDVIPCYPVVGGLALFPQWGVTKTYENKMSNDALQNAWGRAVLELTEL